MAKQPEVLYISYDGMTDPLGQSQVLPYLKGLSGLGYVITLLSFEKKERYDQSRQIIEDICGDAGINWHPVSYTSSPPVISTLKDIALMRRLAYSLHRKHRYGIVHCRSYIAALVGLNMKRRLGVRFLFDMRGFWADERVEGGLWNLDNPLYRLVYRFFKKKEKQFLQEADGIISLTQAAKDEIAGWGYMKEADSRITVIPCCVDTDLFDPSTVSSQKKEELLASLGISSRPVIGYVGSVGTWYMLDEMLHFFRTLQSAEPGAVLLFVSNEPESLIREAAKESDIGDGSFIIRSVKRKDVPVYISIMDYSLFFIRPCFSKKASSPTKQGEIMAMGVPAICNSGVGDTDGIINKYHSGVLVADFSETGYEKAIDQLNSSLFDPGDIRKGALDFYQLDKGITLYSRVYRQLITSD